MASNLNKFLVIVCLAGLAACGVRGKPQPPLTPPELSRGQPTFKRATQEFAFPEVPAVGATPDPRKKREGVSE